MKKLSTLKRTAAIKATQVLFVMAAFSIWPAMESRVNLDLVQHVHAAIGLVVLDHAVGQGEEGVIAADADVGPGAKPGAALADQDVAGHDRLAAKFFHAEPLAYAVATVA